MCPHTAAGVAGSSSEGTTHHKGAFKIARSMLMSRILVLIMALSLSMSATAQQATMVLHNANVNTVDANRPSAEAVVIAGERIIFVGGNAEAKGFVRQGTEVIDCKGGFLMPGLIEGHGHIHGMGESLVALNLMKAKNWDEICAMVAEAVGRSKPGDWIVGRGWHQEKWEPAPARNHLGYPYHESLDKVSPNNPVLLTHASGHSSYVNGLALRLSGINDKTASPPGGDIVKDKAGRILGVLEEKAQSIVWKQYTAWDEKRPEADRKAEWRKSISLAEGECLRQGVTSFVDAGSSFRQVAWMKELALEGGLNVRHWVMVRSGLADVRRNASVFSLKDNGNAYLKVRALKVSLDGALGSYGAWLLKPYSDRSGFTGQNTFSIPELKEMATFAWQRGLQLCVHAIGDRANRETIDVFAGQIRKDPSRDHRWRIEHAQHVDPADIPRFREYGIIASMQGIHCTSDGPFVPKRLGEERSATGAYMWRSFLDAGVLVNNGTDVPVEDLDPFANLHASVTRQMKDGTAFFPAQRMTRQEAIHSYTLANAVAAFEEKEKGSVEKGKLADLVVLSRDLLHCRDEDIPSTKALLTIVGGKVRYRDQSW